MTFVLFYITAWVFALVQLRRERDEPTVFGENSQQSPVPYGPPAPLSGMIAQPSEAPMTPRLNEALLELVDPLRGESGELRFAPALPGSDLHKLTTEVLDGFSILPLVPRATKKSGRIGSYRLGSWPWEAGGKPRSERYAPPQGFIQVTQENQNTQISEHFRLRDFLTKDQRDVWPKYVLIDPLLLDKLELTIQELERQGVRVDAVHVMSGFRTPQYNHSGGNTAGRANLSRHMYGDAADAYVDNDRDGQPDDITGDRRVTTADAEKFARAAELVERQHRNLVGGIGVYAACCGHGPFTHVDVRGFRARWRGTGNG